MKDVKTKLALWKKTMISLDELVLLFNEQQSYEERANSILQLESERILQPVKSLGRTTRIPSVAYRYKIGKALLKIDFHSRLHAFYQFLHPAIRLDHYYHLPPSTFETDLPFLNLVDDYLKGNGFPTELAPAPERSAELVGNEKWIDELGGKELLERIGLWDEMKIIPVSDPLMMAINPKELHNEIHYHLIVENKTTYQGLLPSLSETCFSTLIYGCGTKIVKSIEQFDWQYPLKDATHTFFYFGDIDKSGLTIWHLLNEKRRVLPASPFYSACLLKQPFKGKEQQRLDLNAIVAFIEDMPRASHLEKLFEDGMYYPQEILNSGELRKIWREWSWKFMN